MVDVAPVPSGSVAPESVGSVLATLDTTVSVLQTSTKATTRLVIPEAMIVC